MPAHWLVLAFGAGIAAEHWWDAPRILWLSAVAIALAAGISLVIVKRLALAGVLTLLAWFALGGLALRIQQRAIPQNDAERLITAGKIDTSQPLRWRGRLRDDPERLPWGWRYTIDLDFVSVAGNQPQIAGGLRLTYYFGRDTAMPAPLRAGDEVEALCQARIPRNYLDRGPLTSVAFWRPRTLNSSAPFAALS